MEESELIDRVAWYVDPDWFENTYARTWPGGSTTLEVVVAKYPGQTDMMRNNLRAKAKQIIDLVRAYDKQANTNTNLEAVRERIPKLYNLLCELSGFFGSTSRLPSMIREALVRGTTSSYQHAELRQVIVAREQLRRLVDLTWGLALEDGSVPSTKIADELIARSAPTGETDLVNEGHNNLRTRDDTKSPLVSSGRPDISQPGASSQDATEFRTRYSTLKP